MSGTTKPKVWDGGEKAKPKRKRTVKPLDEPAEKIPDEVEVIDEQTTLDTVDE